MIIAIDPGANGGIVAQVKPSMVLTKKMPETEKDICDLFTDIINNYRRPGEKIFGCIEKVSGIAGLRDKYVNCRVCSARGKVVYRCRCGNMIDIKEGDPGARAFKFGENYGILKSQFLLRKIRFETPTPQAWQKALSLGKKDGYGYEAKKNWKNKLKAKAQEYYPDTKVTLWSADALLILKYAMLREG